MNLIDDFVSEYERQFDFWEALARTARDLIENELANSGLRAIVTSRAKSVSGLRDKLHARNPNKRYTSIKMIEHDIVDFAGVRVALYFPGQTFEVERIIGQLFEVVETKPFPPPTPPNSPVNGHSSGGVGGKEDSSTQSQSKKRFSGYNARHYRIKIPIVQLRPGQERYSAALVEIQVASVLMHAWSEVEHDLAYKPSSGDLSATEHAILDQLNGLVLAGEIALEQLQKAGEERVATTGEALRSHYELGEYIRTRLKELGTDLSASGLGRVDVLFDYLAEQGSVRTALIDPYLKTLSQESEEGPVAARLADLMLSGDEERYDAYRRAMSKSGGTRGRAGLTLSEIKTDSPRTLAVGKFMAEWIALESLVRPPVEAADSRIQSVRAEIDGLVNAGIISQEQKSTWNEIRKLRNRTVHGMADDVSTERLLDAAAKLHELSETIRKSGTGPN